MRETLKNHLRRYWKVPFLTLGAALIIVSLVVFKRNKYIAPPLTIMKQAIPPTPALTPTPLPTPDQEEQCWLEAEECQREAEKCWRGAKNENDRIFCADEHSDCISPLKDCLGTCKK